MRLNIKIHINQSNNNTNIDFDKKSSHKTTLISKYETKLLKY